MEGGQSLLETIAAYSGFRRNIHRASVGTLVQRLCFKSQSKKKKRSTNFWIGMPSTNMQYEAKCEASAS